MPYLSRLNTLILNTNIMKLSEKFKEALCYVFLLGIVVFMLLGCNVKLSKRQKTQDEIQMQFFKEQIKIRTHYLTLNNLNNIQK